MGRRNNYAEIGTRTNTAYFRRLLAIRVQLPGLHKERCRYWDSKQHSIFPKATAKRVQLTGLQKEICPYWDSNQHILFPKSTGNTCSANWAAKTNMPILGLEPTQFFFWRLLATRVQLAGLQKEKCRYWDSNLHRLFPKATGNTRSTTWTAERNWPILGLEQTQFISDGF